MGCSWALLWCMLGATQPWVLAELQHEDNPIYTQDRELIRQRFLDLRRRIEQELMARNKSLCYQCYYSPPRTERHLVDVQRELDNGELMFETEQVVVNRKEVWDKCRGPLTRSYARRYGVSLGQCWNNCFSRIDSQGNLLRGCYRGEYGIDPNRLGCHSQGGYTFCFCQGDGCNGHEYSTMVALAEPLAGEQTSNDTDNQDVAAQDSDAMSVPPNLPYNSSEIPAEGMGVIVGPQYTHTATNFEESTDFNDQTLHTYNANVASMGSANFLVHSEANVGLHSKKQNTTTSYSTSGIHHTGYRSTAVSRVNTGTTDTAPYGDNVNASLSQEGPHSSIYQGGFLDAGPHDE